jgi:GTP-binding protein
MTKADLPEVREAYPAARAAFAELGTELRLISAATHEGLDDLMRELAEQLLL